MDPLLQALVDAGILEFTEATALWLTLSPADARAEAERVMLDAFAQGLTAQQARLLDLLRRTNFQPTRKQLSDFWGWETRRFWSVVSPTILDQVSQAATIAAITGGVDDWEAVATEALNFAQSYYLSAEESTLGSLPNLNLTSRQQFEQQFSRWLNGELPGQQERNRFGMLGGQGIEDLIVALEPTFGPTRAERIAVTETTRIFSLATEAAESRNPDIVGFRLLTSADDRVCSICGPLHRQVRRRGALFVHPTLGPIQGPPFHPRCRCDIVGETAISLEFESDDQFTYEG